MLTDYSQLPLAERNDAAPPCLPGRRPSCTLEDWQRVGQLIVNAFRADVTRMGATKETDQLIAELSQQRRRVRPFLANAMTSPVMEKAISALTTRRWVRSTWNLPPLPWRGRPDLSLLVFNPATTESQRKNSQVYFRGCGRLRGKLVQRQRIALQRVDPQPIAIEPGFIHAGAPDGPDASATDNPRRQGRCGCERRPPAGITRRGADRTGAAFDASAAIQPCSRTL